MQLFNKICVYFLIVISHLTSVAFADPYHLVAGSSALGLLENDKQNVTLGFSSAFNSMLGTLNVKCDFKSFDSSDELAKAIEQNQVNAFFGSPVEFLKAESYFLENPIASGIIGNQLKSRILLVVRAESEIKSLAQLRGKKLSIQKFIANDLGGLYLETLLLENKLPLIKNFFLETQSSETSNRALVDLFFKKVDATLLSENYFQIAVELNPQLLLQTRILVASEPYLIFVAALRKGTPPQEIDGIKNSLLNVNKTAKGKSILNLMKVQGFKEISLNDLSNVRDLIAKNQQLKLKQNAN